jgi:hypothetical protein
MPQTVAIHRSLVEAVTKFVDSLHHIYSGIKIKPIFNYEDEDFTFEIRIPKNLSIDQVLETCHKECIKVEDEYELFMSNKEGDVEKHDGEPGQLTGLMKNCGIMRTSA